MKSIPGASATGWQNVLELDSQRNLAAGSEPALADAIRRGADLRIYTEFRHNEHIDVDSDNDELVEETSEFGVTYLVQDSWSAGIMNLRQPIELPYGFGPRPSMSFFLYNQDGRQAIARPYLDGQQATGNPGAGVPEPPLKMPKYHTHDVWDSQTNAPSSNFVYDFGVFRFYVHDVWREVLSHDAQGTVISGSMKELAEAAAAGCQLKVGVRDLCAGLGGEALSHEVFVQAGPCYYYTKQGVMIAGSHPLIRVKTNIPMSYDSNGWDFGWLMLRSDGQVVYRRCDPYSLAFNDVPGRYAIRWFVR